MENAANATVRFFVAKQLIRFQLTYSVGGPSMTAEPLVIIKSGGSGPRDSTA